MRATTTAVTTGLGVKKYYVDDVEEVEGEGCKTWKCTEATKENRD